MNSLKIKIFADGADFNQIMQLAKNSQIKGFTTNPTLMRKAGVSDYAEFARRVLGAITDRPISFEVFADDLPGMVAQGREIASWGRNANVKIPITNTEGTFCGPVIKELTEAGIIVNVTAIMTPNQVKEVAAVSQSKSPIHHLGLCRACCRYGSRPCAPDERVPGEPEIKSKGGAIVGKSTRASQHLSGQ